jgi:predicted membrane protein
MRNQGLILIGVVLIAAGLMFLLGNLLDINISAFCFPLGLILLGVFLIMRPRMVGPDTRSEVLLIGDLDRSGAWDVMDEEVWAFIGDISYDLTKATVPKGDTTVRVNGFINDVEIFARENVGLSINATSVITSFNEAGQPEEESFLAPVKWQSDNYKLAERRVHFDLTQFIGDISVRVF